MLLPAGLDRIPELIGRLCSNASGWRPQSKAVELAWTDAGDQRLVETVCVGTIKEIRERVLIVSQSSKGIGGPALLVELFRPLQYDGESLTRLVAIPRFTGHRPERLLVTWCVVNVFRASSLEKELDWSNVVGICLMRLHRTLT